MNLFYSGTSLVEVGLGSKQKDKGEQHRVGAPLPLSGDARIGVALWTLALVLREISESNEANQEKRRPHRTKDTKGGGEP